jgi:two-component system, OmpR family, phosphate regulon sensor histidine kinase PhoR
LFNWGDTGADTSAVIAALLQGLPHAALIITPDSKVALANAQASALFGPALLGRHYAIALRHPDLLNAVAMSLNSDAASHLRLTLRQGDVEGGYAITLSPLPIGTLLLLEDITPQDQTEQMRRDFVANVSHELRTPLTALQGFIETLQGPAQNDAAARARFFAIMATEAERMNRLVVDLLHLSRVEAQERLRPQHEIDLAATIGRAVDGLRPLAQQAQVALVCTGLDAPKYLRADADQIMQVLVNLVENAIKYGSAPGGQVAVVLTETVTLRGPAYCLWVQDQGAGIAAEHIPRLTERFYRIDSHRSRAQGGTGLGLAIVKHIVSRHRGKLSIESTPGQGSRFSVFLPIG